MAKTEVLKVRLEPEQDDKLGRLAKARGVTKSFIVRELIHALSDQPTTTPVVKIVYEVQYEGKGKER